MTNGEWKTVALGELMPGRGESVDPASHSDETFDLYSIPAYDSQMPEVLSGAQIGSTKQAVETGDVLLSKIVPHIRRAWVVGASSGRRMIASSEWIVFRNTRIFPGYMRHLLVEDRFHAKFMSTVSGVGGSLLRARPAHVAKIEIPLPPLAEQRRIAEVLDRAEALRSKRRVALAQLDSLTQSLFLDLFGDPTRNDNNWPRQKLVDLVTVTYGFPFDSARFVSSGDIPVVRIRDVVRGFSDTYYDGPEAHDECHWIKNGDILVGMDGEFNCARWRGGTALLNQRVCRFATNSEILNDEYLYALLPYFLKRIEAETPFVTVKHLSAKQIKAVVAPLPPIEKQREFARRVTAVEALKTAQRASLAELDALFAALQHRAFRGEL